MKPPAKTFIYFLLGFIVSLPIAWYLLGDLPLWEIIAISTVAGIIFATVAVLFGPKPKISS
ncbi:MAG: hypothetical protein A2Z42_01155 [Candidatus Woykebacteria bacterium RBG_19FT_COMBO_43_10]|uniref:DUF4175 domain-containing protein n=1 Tax=Candidatus Woykebacteria bacterium RBG_19FT_COMBO_43_10 TaxID=1802598 RepID=A0A1G1WIS1_9BACT|nr:MAG: hypothetical protein A2Z42_01155 [Candidatus Woykebacteria bacterium RBG_19FT_COMBO_43_10]